MQSTCIFIKLFPCCALNNMGVRCINWKVFVLGSDKTFSVDNGLDLVRVFTLGLGSPNIYPPLYTHVGALCVYNCKICAS